MLIIIIFIPLLLLLFLLLEKKTGLQPAFGTQLNRFFLEAEVGRLSRVGQHVSDRNRGYSLK